MGHRLVVVMPAYNAAATLERTWRDVPRDVVDEIILVDDASANQKTCYRAALERPCFQDRRRTAHREGGN